jgi:hypothetical protein
MSQNRFEYAEICPTCKDAGAVGEDGKPVTIGFDLDTHEISCGKGHVYDRLPSEAVAVAESGDKNAGTVAETRDSLLRNEATLTADLGLSDAAAEGAVCHSLETVSGSDARISAQADSAALAELSERMQEPAVEVKLPSAEDLDAVVAEQDARARAATATRTLPGDYLVAEGEGVNLPNGDLLLGLRIPEQWRQAVEAEAENQGKGSAQYLADWLTSEEMRSAIVDALVAYWSSSFTQTVAGSPR